MQATSLVCIAAAALTLVGCDSGSEGERERENADSPAAQVVRDFYDAANDADGEKACSLLTDTGVRTVVRVRSRRGCVRTVAAFERGSFAADGGELVEIEGVEERGDAFDVDAVVKGRTAGTYAVVDRNGRLLIDSFEPEEG